MSHQLEAAIHCAVVAPATGAVFEEERLQTTAHFLPVILSVHNATVQNDLNRMFNKLASRIRKTHK